MEMSIDEAGNADHACAVDDLCGWRLDHRGDCDDRAVTDMHVAGGEVGHGGSMVSTVAPRMSELAASG